MHLNNIAASRLLPYVPLSAQALQALPEYEVIRRDYAEFLNLLETAHIRAAQKNECGEWCVNIYVKQLILLGFKIGKLVPMGDSSLAFVDNDMFPVRRFEPSNKIRIVPGGVSVRRGASVSPSAVIMPPSYINVGAFVDEGCLIDSNSLVGSCAQVGKRVHLSAGVQLGGVLEPVGGFPVIIEDEVFIGGNSGIYEGTCIGSQAVIGAGVILTRSSRIYDLVNETVIAAAENQPLKIPPQAVVVAGARQIKGPFAEGHGLSLHTPIIVKYRDGQTSAKTQAELALRMPSA